MLDRRTAISAIGGGLALAATAPAALAAAPRWMGTPTGRMRAFMLMRGALDDRLVTGCFTGRYWGCVNGVMTPLFNVESVMFSRYKPLPDGSYRSVSVEQSYFTDKTTGEWLKSFVNPYTGKTVKVPTDAYPPVVAIFKPNLELHVAALPPGMVLKHVSTPFVVQGDAVIMNEIVDVVTTPRGGGKPGLHHEITTLHARASDLRRPNAKRVPCAVTYTNVKSWRNWLEMGDHPGETISVGDGSFGVPPSDFPKTWIDATRQFRPELLDNPVKMLEPLWRDKSSA